ncbi:MAG: hypothetical protein IPH12_21510 [Saprospirales bacterium]|jgi:two-component system NarL family sensor kinase|nr:hypothetical protein [Saprospirales bacterium]MBK8920586.1 hypothetical protein [Saprospirales bacterium]
MDYLERAYYMERYLLNENRLHSIDEIEIRYRTAEKEKQLALVENQNLVKARQLLRQRWSIALLTLGLALSVLLSLFFRKQKQLVRLAAARERAEHEQALALLRAEKEFSEIQALFAGQEQERRRVANDLHDSLGGLLYALRLQLPAGTPEKTRRALEAAMAENRRISQALLPPALARVGLCAALREWREQFEQRFGLPMRLELPEAEPALPDDTTTALFRIAQELTTNAAKHATGAGWVAVQITLAGNQLRLKVADNGAGFEPSALPETAFKTVRSRVRLLGGQLRVESAPGQGACLQVEAPLEAINTQN